MGRTASCCIAVGAETDSSGSPKGTLAERWNGAAWSIQPTPNWIGTYRFDPVGTAGDGWPHPDAILALQRAPLITETVPS